MSRYARLPDPDNGPRGSPRTVRAVLKANLAKNSAQDIRKAETRGSGATVRPTNSAGIPEFRIRPPQPTL